MKVRPHRAPEIYMWPGRHKAFAEAPPQPPQGQNTQKGVDRAGPLPSCQGKA